MFVLNRVSATGPGRYLLRKAFLINDISLQKPFAGLVFKNPIGLAAGFDQLLQKPMIFLTNTPALNPVSAITVSAWFRIAAMTGVVQGIVAKDVSGSVSNPPYVLQVTTADVLQYGQTPATGSGANANTGVINPGTWYFGVGTFDGSTLRVYLNGELQNSSTNSDIGATTGVLRIGQQKSFAGRWFNGLVDDVRVYNRALSGTEIQQLYQGGAL